MKAPDQDRTAETKEAAFGRKFLKAFARLAKDKETTRRFCRTTTAAQYWMCLSKWLAEHPKKTSDSTVLGCMRSLANAMTSAELAYVLQFETEPCIVRLLAGQITRTVRRETTADRLHERRKILSDGLCKPFLDGVSVAELAERTGTHFINRLYSAMRRRAAYLRGEGLQGDHGLFSDWCLAYDHPVVRMTAAAEYRQEDPHGAC